MAISFMIKLLSQLKWNEIKYKRLVGLSDWQSSHPQLEFPFVGPLPVMRESVNRDYVVDTISLEGKLSFFLQGSLLNFRSLYKRSCKNHPIGVDCDVEFLELFFENHAESKPQFSSFPFKRREALEASRTIERNWKSISQKVSFYFAPVS